MFLRHANDWQLDRDIDNAIREYIQKCPIRLYDTQNHQFFTRQMLGQYLDGEMVTIGDLVGNDQSEGTIQKAVERVGSYAILSHRWDEEEIFLDDIPATLNSGQPVKEEAQRKLKGFFKAARSYGCRFVWFDTGCIDQKNGPELEESIRSMFSWYRNAHVCIVYLGETSSDRPFYSDEWFRRGWTLQELLAPKRLQLYDRSWGRIGAIDRTDRTHDAQFLDRIVSKIGISEEHLIELITPGPDHAVAMFQYISSRKTTRPEDISYALISLLDVSMPIAYGEGSERAFYRLQVACCQDIPSRALFHWLGIPCRWNSMLAREPFAFCHNGWVEDFLQDEEVVDGVVAPIEDFSIASHISFDDCFVKNHKYKGKDAAAYEGEAEEEDDEEEEEEEEEENNEGNYIRALGVDPSAIMPGPFPSQRHCNRLDKLLQLRSIDNSFAFTNSGVSIMIWILRPTARPKLLKENDDTNLYSYSVFNKHDVIFSALPERQFRGKYVIGVYGHDGEQTFAALLRKGSPGAATGYTRINDMFIFRKLPPMSAIMASKFATPQRVFIK